MPPGRSAAAPARRIAPCSAREPLGLVGGLAPARVGAAGERAEVRARRVDEHAVVGAGLVPARRRRRRGRSTQRRAHPLPRCAERRGAAAGGARPRRSRRVAPSARRGGSSCRRARRTGRARARPGAGRAARATAIAARDCGMNSPSRHSGAPWASKGASSTSALGQLGGRRGSATGSALAPARRRSSAACWRAARASAGSLSAAISARARRRGRARPTTARRSTRGASGAARPPAGVSVGQRVDQRARLARGAAQHGVDEAGAAARVRLGELDRLADRGVGGDAVEVGELEDAEPQRGEHGGLERGRAGGRASVSITWSSVARRWTAP